MQLWQKRSPHSVQFLGELSIPMKEYKWEHSGRKRMKLTAKVSAFRSIFEADSAHSQKVENKHPGIGICIGIIKKVEMLMLVSFFISVECSSLRRERWLVQGWLDDSSDSSSKRGWNTHKSSIWTAMQLYKYYFTLRWHKLDLRAFSVNWFRLR